MPQRLCQTLVRKKCVRIQESGSVRGARSARSDVDASAGVYGLHRAPCPPAATPSRPAFYAWDAILLSGSGNDLIDSAPHLLKRIDAETSEPSDYVDSGALQLLLADIPEAMWIRVSD